MAGEGSARELKTFCHQRVRSVIACVRGYFRVTVTGARHLIDRKFYFRKMTNIATPQPLNYKIRKRLSGLAMEALARLVQSSLCAQIVLPFNTGIWPQLVSLLGHLFYRTHC